MNNPKILNKFLIDAPKPHRYMLHDEELYAEYQEALNKAIENGISVNNCPVEFEDNVLYDIPNGYDVEISLKRGEEKYATLFLLKTEADKLFEEGNEIIKNLYCVLKKEDDFQDLKRLERVLNDFKQLNQDSHASD